MFSFFKKVNRPILNITKGRTISNSYIICDNFVSRSFGLMFRRNPPRSPFIFVFRKETLEFFHTFFMFFPIHIYFLDKNRKITEIFYAKPWKIVKPAKKYKYVIESFDELDIGVGDILEW